VQLRLLLHQEVECGYVGIHEVVHGAHHWVIRRRDRANCMPTLVLIMLDSPLPWALAGTA
jgi:hypothetical protein